MNEKYLDIVRMLLDHQLLDSNYIECGKVEDVELAGDANEMRVVAILTGPGAAACRLPNWLGKLSKMIIGGRVTRVPWKEVNVVTSQIKLKSRAAELSLADADLRAAEWLKKLPGAE